VSGKALAAGFAANPEPVARCRPEQATGAAAGTSVAGHPSGTQQGGRMLATPLRRSGNGFGDLVPAYVSDPGLVVNRMAENDSRPRRIPPIASAHGRG
jgi:hypothetical protein